MQFLIQVKTNISEGWLNTSYGGFTLEEAQTALDYLKHGGEDYKGQRVLDLRISSRKGEGTFRHPYYHSTD